MAQGQRKDREESKAGHETQFQCRATVPIKITRLNKTFLWLNRCLEIWQSVCCLMLMSPIFARISITDVRGNCVADLIVARWCFAKPSSDALLRQIDGSRVRLCRDFLITSPCCCWSCLVPIRIRQELVVWSAVMQAYNCVLWCGQWWLIVNFHHHLHNWV